MPRTSLLVSVCLVLAAGCGVPSAEVQQEDTAQRLRSLAYAYGQFTVDNKRPPRNETELREAVLRLKMGDPDTLLKSPRDGQPFVIVWGFDVRQTGAGYEGGNKANADSAGAVYIYERQGSDGHRYVLYTHGGVRLLPEAELRQARFLGDHRPK